jgi:gamma-glutamylcyclotransferase (GGCT)/AIG2-like uncharacterized protein YtfP
MPLYYFAYGSNLYPKRMKKRCPQSEPCGRGILPGYRMVFCRHPRRGTGVASVETLGGNKVTGMVYRISDEDLKRLDRHEGYPHLYRRIEVRVKIDSRWQWCLTYQLPKGYAYERPDPAYLELIRAGYLAWELPIDELYEALRA